MAKRVVGWVWIAAGILVVVASAILLPAGAVVSVIAALCLAAGLAASVYGVTVVVRAQGEALRDATDSAEAQRRARRSMWIIVAGAVASPMVAVAYVVATVVGGKQVGPPHYALLGVGALALVGGAVLAIALSRSRRTVPDETEPGVADPPEGDAWMVVTGRDVVAILLYASSWVGIAVLLALWTLRLIMLAIESAPAGWVIVVVCALTLCVAVGWWLWRRFPSVSVNPGRGLVRAGGQEILADEVSSARLTATSIVPGGPRTLFLTLEGPKGFHAPLLLRRGGRVIMSDVERGAALAIVRAASIVVPHAPEDPRGKFSRVTHPGYVDAAQAVSLIEQPPRDGEELPAAPR